MMRTDDALALLASRTDPAWTLSLHRVVPLNAAAPVYQREGWTAVVGDPLRWIETVRQGWGSTPEAAVNALLEGNDL